MRIVRPREGASNDATVQLKGIRYLEALSALHDGLLPRNYLEIGSASGDSLKLASCATVAIDPQFAISTDVIGAKPSLYLLQQGTPAAFADPAIATLLPQGADLMFVDGLHVIEAVIDDLIGVETLSNGRTVAVFHDVLPVNNDMAERGAVPRSDKATQDWWTGDVWKIIPILARHRPDLKVAVLDCQPTGIMIVQGLDRRNGVLAPLRNRLVEEWRDIRLADYGIGRFYEETPILSAASTADVIAVVARGRV